MQDQVDVPGDVEIVGHVSPDQPELFFGLEVGDILWSSSFAWDLGSDTQFGIPVFGATVSVPAPCRVLFHIAAILAPLGYSGPCCANYKVLPSGEIAIFEINPRLGGSLMNPRNIDLLRQAMAHIVYNAR